MRRLGDFDLAEELVQDALVVALERWPVEGVPPNPAGWLMTTAVRRGIDRLRRATRYRDKLALLEREAQPVEDASGDDRLTLIFTCCHPALAREAQLALTLRSVAGLTTAQIARAFVAPEATIAQRIVRAKRKIVEAHIPFRVPEPSRLPDRLDEVLTVLYLMFNEGYLASGGDAPERRELAVEAAWMAATLVELMPDESEALALLALMRLHLARAGARFDAAGDLVLLDVQDRSLWNHEAIADAGRLVARAARMGRPGPYAVQAAIAALHAEAASTAATDWSEIVRLYDLLLTLAPSPVVALNRAIALGRLSGPAAGLAAIDEIGPALDRYHLRHAARGELLHALGRIAESRTALGRALTLVDNPAERALLERRLHELEAQA